MRRFINIVVENSQSPIKLYHITDKAKFKLDPSYAPTDNAISIFDRSGNRGIYLARDVEPWVNGHGYIRPFVAEIEVDPSAVDPSMGRWGGEVFVPATEFDKLKVIRVIPLDALCRETYGRHGWLESSHGYAFDTGEEITTKDWEQPFAGYRYERDVRTMSSEEVKQLKQRFRAGYKARMG
jgi:hypothetical protein